MQRDIPDDEVFARLLVEQGILVMPGSMLSTSSVHSIFSVPPQPSSSEELFGRPLKSSGCLYGLTHPYGSYPLIIEAADAAYDGRLCVREGDPVTVLPALAAELGAGSVHVSRGDVPVRMARLDGFDFYQRVRDKFHLT